MSDLLSVRGLRLRFESEQGPVEVLDHVNLAIARGQVVGLVGESGCGKTTLARAILGILPASARVLGGEIVFDGVDLLHAGADDLDREIRGRRITFIPQDPFGSFNPVFTIGAQIMELMKWKSPHGTGAAPGSARVASRRAGMAALLRPYRRARRRADRQAVIDLLRQVQIPDPEQILRKYPHQVSGGQRQRLMIAMALLPRPDLIIADEPTTALDVTIQAQILLLLRRLVKEHGVSVLFTTHDLGTAHEICDRIVVLYAGQEMEEAPVARFFREPAHPYTRMLLESLPHPDGVIRDIPGEIPPLVNPPPGCRFHPRCPAAADECRRSRPAPAEVGERHWVRCYHPVTAGDHDRDMTSIVRTP
ncbi:MAG: ABC transporter ATP-binding protein [Gemmatimonadota bacterium]